MLHMLLCLRAASCAQAIARGETALLSVSMPAAAWTRAGAPVVPGPTRSAAFALSLPGVGLSDVEAWVASAQAEKASAGEGVGASSGTASASVHRANTLLVDPEARETVEVSIKYKEALVLQQRSISRVQRSANRLLPDDLDYRTLHALSTEEVQKLSDARPRTLREASEISGVTPHAIGSLLVALRDYDAHGQRRDSTRATTATGDLTEKQRRKALARASLAH